MSNLQYQFPEIIDSTMLAAFRSCPRKFYLEFIQHWKPKTTNVHLHAGAAFAAGLEEARRAYYERGESEADSVARGLAMLIRQYGDDYECPEGSAKSLQRMAGALEYHFDEYPLATDQVVPARLTKELRWGDEVLEVETDNRAIEFRFNEELPYVHPETGKNLRYVGRADMIANYAGGTYIHDDKTTSSLGSTWSNQWDLRSQFTGYAWAASNCGFKVNGIIVRGIAILKTKFNTQQAITNRGEWEIERWMKQVQRDLARMEKCWQDKYWDYDLDASCTHYGGCTFRKVCLSPQPELWLPTEFTRRKWNPLDQVEIPISDEEVQEVKARREQLNLW